MKARQKKTESGNGLLEMAFNIQNVRFVKKMYSPNEIIADIQITPGRTDFGDTDTTITYRASISRDDLEKSFLNKKVKLECDDKLVCDDYYVQEIVSKYKKDAMYVTMKMYSPDYLMTLGQNSRAFVAKQLISDILNKQIENYRLPYENKSLTFEASGMKHIKKNNSEHIFPYLVQYKESFYDFLKRTTNRWGEFLYYEENKLHIGYIGKSNKIDCKNLADSITFSDLTKSQAQPSDSGNRDMESPVDELLLNGKYKIGTYDTVTGEINSVGNKELRGDEYVMKKAGRFLTNDKTVWSFLADIAVDDLVSYQLATMRAKKKTADIDNNYFGEEALKGHPAQYDGSKTMLNLHSEFTPILNADEYAKIVRKELSSGLNSIVMDFDTTYPDVKLGETITYDEKYYLIVKIEGYQPERMQIVNNQYFEQVVDMQKICFKITAIPQNRVADTAEGKDVTDNMFYPPVLPTGHIRRSGPQMATISEDSMRDPIRYNRVKVTFPWMPSTEKSPWLMFASPAGTPEAGIHSLHYVKEKVLVDFVDGNVERPYIVGSLETELPLSLKNIFSSGIVYQTKAGQSIRMSDGMGFGLQKMLASLTPGIKMLEGLSLETNFPDFHGNKSLEGNIELCDKYGFWSIKGSTDERNITIKSPWGDVNMNAFTGITISAPNGDVKIQGKNVSIEAGSNLTLTSGKNIKQKFLMEGEEVNCLNVIKGTALKTATKKLASSLIAITDISLLRHFCEVFIKPVEGKLELNAGRYLMLESGGGKAAYPVDAYKKAKKTEEFKKMVNPRQTADTFGEVVGMVGHILDIHQAYYETAKQKKAILVPLVEATKKGDEYQCKSVADIIRALWNQTGPIKEAVGFKGAYIDVGVGNNPDDYVEVIQYFSPAYARSVWSRKTTEEKRRQWADVVWEQKRRKQEILNATTELAIAILALKQLSIRAIANVNRDNYPELYRVMKNDNLPANCLIKTIASKDGFKDFSADYETVKLKRSSCGLMAI